MSDPLQKVTSGQKLKIPAATWNTFVDAARDYLQRRLNGGAATPPGSGRTPGVVLVQNGTGADLDAFQIVGLNAPIFGPADNLEEFQFRFAFTGVTPTDDHFGCFGVILEPLKAGAIGQALVDGLTPVRVRLPDPTHPPDDANDLSMQYADITNVEGEETTHLTLQARGAGRVLWMEADDDEETGDRWALVRLSNASAAPPVAGIHTLKVTGIFAAYNVPFVAGTHPLIAFVTGYFAFGDKSWVDTSTTYFVKATHLPATARIGFKNIQVDDFIGYVLADGFEAVPGAPDGTTYHGQVIAFPGPEGALLTTSTQIAGGPGIVVEADADPSVDRPKVSVDLADSDPGLEFDDVGDDGKLKVLPDETQAITVTDDGVSLKIEKDNAGQNAGGLEFAQDGDLKVLPNENEGITVKTPQGVSAKLEPDHGLVFAQDGDMMVVVKQAGGVDVDQNGLFAVVDPTRGIDVDANGLFAIVNEQAGMTVDADGLAVKIVNEPGGLTYDNAGNVKHNTPDPNVVTERAYFEGVYGENIGKTGDGSIQFDKNGHLNALDGASVIHTGPGAQAKTATYSGGMYYVYGFRLLSDANNHCRGFALQLTYNGPWTEYLLG